MLRIVASDGMLLSDQRDGAVPGGRVLSGEWEGGIVGQDPQGWDAVCCRWKNMTLRKSRLSHYKCQDFTLVIIAHDSKGIERN